MSKDIQTYLAEHLLSLLDKDTTIEEVQAILKVYLNAKGNVDIRTRDGRTLLMHAKTTEQTKLLLEAGANAKAVDYYGCTALHYVSTPEQANLLIKAGTDVNVCAQYKNMTAVREAIRAQNFDIAKVLLKSGAFFSYSDRRDDLPEQEALVQAVKRKDCELAKLLIDAGADVNIVVRDNYRGCYQEDITALRLAAWQNDPDMTKILLEGGADVNACDHYGYAALDYAIGENSNIETIKLLIDAGADVDKALCSAVISERFDIGRMLLEAGADVNKSDKHDMTALDYARTEEQVKFLLEIGANRCDRALMNFVEKNNFDVVKTLLKSGIDVNTQDKDGYTALMIAPTAEMAQFLLESGADVNACDYEGYTALHRAASAEITEVLINAGADVNIHTQNNVIEDDSIYLYEYERKGGETALHLARCVEQTKLLLKAGADVNARDNCGFTALMKAETAEQTKLLLGSGAEVNACTYLFEKSISHEDDDTYVSQKGYVTALMYAQTAEQTKLLLKAGADVNMCDAAGHNALSYAKTVKQAKLLIDAGIDFASCRRHFDKEIAKLVKEAKNRKNIEEHKAEMLKARKTRTKIQKQNPMEKISGVMLADDIAKDKISGKEKRTITPEVGMTIRRKKAFEK